MRVLVVGAGAIGRVYGHAFARGGAAVGFLVRPYQAPEAREGWTLYPMNRAAGERPVPIRSADFAVYTDAPAAATEPWDLVVLAVTSLALRDGDWLDRLCNALGDGHLLSLLPGSDDPQYVRARAPEGRLSFGLLSLMAFHAPLPGQDLPRPGVAWWLPPRSALAFSGPEPITSRIASTLALGGLPTRVVADVPAQVAFSGPILAHLMSAFECAGWSLQALRRDAALLPLAVGAMRETWALAAQVHQTAPPALVRGVSVPSLRLVLRLAPWLPPFDLEAFLAAHYQKVSAQHRTHLRKLVDGCASRGLPNGRLRALQGRLTGEAG